jgi:hypothetical protein
MWQFGLFFFQEKPFLPLATPSFFKKLRKFKKYRISLNFILKILNNKKLKSH